jgi:hypothetical protein
VPIIDDPLARGASHTHTHTVAAADGQRRHGLCAASAAAQHGMGNRLPVHRTAATQIHLLRHMVIGISIGWHRKSIGDAQSFQTPGCDHHDASVSASQNHRRCSVLPDSRL